MRGSDPTVGVSPRAAVGTSIEGAGARRDGRRPQGGQLAVTHQAPPKLRSLLAATDFSASAAVGLEWAAALTAEHGARLHLVHALALTGWAMDYGEPENRIRARLEADLAARLEVVADELRARQLNVSWEVGSGLPSGVVAAAAGNRAADLVVIGARGHRRLEYLLLGSTAQRVVQCSPCPVLTVHPQDTGHTRPVRRILAATDFSIESETAITASLMFLGEPPAASRFVLLHVYHVPYDLDSPEGKPSTAVGLKQWKRLEGDVIRRLERLAAPLARRGLDVELLAVEGFPPEAIVAKAVETEADLVVMGTRGRTGLAHVLLGSTAERVIHTAPCPVLTSRRQESKSARRRSR